MNMLFLYFHYHGRVLNTLKQKAKQQSDSEKDRLGLSECSNCIGLSSRILELEEPLGKQNQFISADKMIISNNSNNATASKNILDFEFSKPNEEIRNYVDSFIQSGNTCDVWFSGKIDTITGRVIVSSYGRISLQQSLDCTHIVNESHGYGAYEGNGCVIR